LEEYYELQKKYYFHLEWRTEGSIVKEGALELNSEEQKGFQKHTDGWGRVFQA
jgi:hypothetical protein